jgi:hypothetical protein
MSRMMGFWLLSLTVVAISVSAITAQVLRSEPRVVSGSDLGFRIEGTDPRSGKPVGVLVVRVNGQWVDVKESIAPSRLTQ